MLDARDLIRAIRADDFDGVRASIAADPELARSRDENGVSVVCLAVYFGREEIARLLARARDDLDVFEASTLGQTHRVRELIASAPELVDAYSPDGFHPLGFACFFGRRELVEILLECGADLEAPARNPMQVRPIHSAAAHADPDLALVLVRTLLEAGASPNVVQQGGFTPLHEAAFRGRAELVRELLRHRADVTACNADGETPGDLARQNGHQEVATLLDLVV